MSEKFDSVYLLRAAECRSYYSYRAYIIVLRESQSYRNLFCLYNFLINPELTMRV